MDGDVTSRDATLPHLEEHKHTCLNNGSGESIQCRYEKYVYNLYQTKPGASFLSDLQRVRSVVDVAAEVISGCFLKAYVGSVPGEIHVSGFQGEYVSVIPPQGKHHPY